MRRDEPDPREIKNERFGGLEKYQDEPPEEATPEDDTEVIEVPDFEFSEGDYLEHWEDYELAEVEYIKLKYPSEKWEYVIYYPESHESVSVNISRAEENYTKMLAPECPACGNKSEFSVDSWKCFVDDCPVKEFEGELQEQGESE